jgi:hypothetical protein
MNSSFDDVPSTRSIEEKAVKQKKSRMNSSPLFALVTNKQEDKRDSRYFFSHLPARRRRRR